MPLGMLSIFSFINTINNIIQPSTLLLTGWWRDFSSVPWAGTASAGSSGSNSFADPGVTDPVQGAPQNGYYPAQFNGTDTFLITTGLTLDDFTNDTAGGIWVLFKANTVPTVAAVDPYDAAGLIALSGSGYIITGVSDLGFVVAGYDSAYQTFQIPASIGTYHLGQMRWDGSRVWGRVDGGLWYSLPCGPIGFMAAELVMGSNYNGLSIFDGEILEAGIISEFFTTSSFNNIKKYVEQRYALNLGSVIETKDYTLLISVDSETNTNTLDPLASGTWGNQQITHSNNFTSYTASTNYPSTIINEFSGCKPSVFFHPSKDCYLETTRFNFPRGLTFYIVFKTTINDTTEDYAGNAPQNIIGDSTGSVYLGFGLTGGQVVYRHYDGTWAEVVSTGLSLNDGNVHSIAVSHDAFTGDVKLYADGIEVDSGNITYATLYAGINRIGSGYNGLDILEDFHIAEIKIYDQAAPSSLINFLHSVSMIEWNSDSVEDMSPFFYVRGPNYDGTSPGTWIDSMGGSNFVGQGGDGPPVDTGGIPDFDSLVDWPLGRSQNISDWATTGDHHFFCVCSPDTITSTTAQNVWLRNSPFKDSNSYIGFHLWVDTGTYYAAYYEWDTAARTAVVSLGVTIPSRIVLQGKKEGGFIWIRLGSDAWIQGDACSTTGSSSGNINIGANFEGKVLAVASWAGTTLSNADSNRLAEIGATMGPI